MHFMDDQGTTLTPTSEHFMRICIHRGTQEIGGTCVEIESHGKRLVLDVGLPLDAVDPETIPLHPVPGFAAPDESLEGVVISHPHQDHYGLAHRLPEQTPFLIGEAAQAILEAAALFSPSGLKLKNVTHLRNGVPIPLGPFTVTPYLVDHSAYDAYAILVEADGKRLFYTGDFRGHGRKASLIDELIDNPPKNVDVLLMEGTCIGREDTAFCTEDDLVPQFADTFRQTKGMPLVWCSGQNIDRIVTIWKACLAARRQFIVDMYTAEVLRATDNPRLPQAGWDGLRVFLPHTQRWRIIEEKAFDISDRYKPYRIYWNELVGAAAKSVMLFRPSMVRDLDKAACVQDGSVVCSVWDGYLEDERNNWFLQWTKDRGLRIHPCHTSGHASISDLQRLRKAFPGAVAVPVHLTDRERFAKLFDGVVVHEDGEWWEY